MRRQIRRFLERVMPDPGHIADNRWLKPFATTLLHPRLWHLNRHSAAGAVAVGLFCGLIPGPLQMLGAALGALLFRVNLPLALATTLYTNPFTIVPLYLVAYQIGRVVTGSGTGFVTPPQPVWPDFLDWSFALLDWLLGLGKPLAVGLPLLALMLAAAGYFVVKAAWRIHLVRAWHRRKHRT